MRHELIFGGLNSADFGVWISGEGTYNAPERSYESISVPGRNGDLIIDNGKWNNIVVTYPAYIESGFKDKFADFRVAFCRLTGYQTLEDTYHPDEYRMGMFVNGLTVEPGQFSRDGKFEISFNCKPQRFLKSGNTPMQYMIINPSGSTFSSVSLPVYNQTDMNFTVHCLPADTLSVKVSKLDSDGTELRNTTYSATDGFTQTVTFENDVVRWRFTVSGQSDIDEVRIDVRTTTIYDSKPFPVNAVFGRTVWIDNPTGYETKPLFEIFSDLIPYTDMRSYIADAEENKFVFHSDAITGATHFYMDCDVQYIYDDAGTNLTDKLFLTDAQSAIGEGLVFPFMSGEKTKIRWYDPAMARLGIIQIYPRWWKL